MHSRNHRSPTAFGKIRKGNTFFGGQEKRNEKVLNATGVWTYATHNVGNLYFWFKNSTPHSTQHFYTQLQYFPNKAQIKVQNYFLWL